MFASYYLIINYVNHTPLAPSQMIDFVTTIIIVVVYTILPTHFV